MSQFHIRYGSSNASQPCSLCGQTLAVSAGPQLVLADSQQLVCHGCARKHAPPLVALLNLADEAQRIGRIGRHTVVPPYTALLDLARAADDYTAALPQPTREAG